MNYLCVKNESDRTRAVVFIGSTVKQNPTKLEQAHYYIPYNRPFRRQMTGLVLNVSFWPELEHKMVFVNARKDDVAVASF